MFSLGKFFPPAGVFRAAYITGALNAAGSVRERGRWIKGYLKDLSGPWADVASRDACDAYDMVRARAKGCKRRQVKRAVTRAARQERISLKNRRGAHWRR